MPANHTDLIETWRMQWVLLHLTVQLDRQWMPSLQRQSQDAIEEVFSIAQKLGGTNLELASLAELRRQLLEQITETGSRLADRLSAEPSPGAREACEAEDILFVARMLDRCVGTNNRELAGDSAAQRALWSSISSTCDRSKLPPRGPDLVRQTCSHVLSRLEDWLDRRRASADAIPSPLFERSARTPTTSGGDTE